MPRVPYAVNFTDQESGNFQRDASIRFKCNPSSQDACVIGCWTEYDVIISPFPGRWRRGWHPIVMHRHGRVWYGVATDVGTRVAS